eukprot:GEMP01069616.1.p1 GENE.GEMP01069616.1~~GEMP01069616.1.p1  ORF type:complete len:279 (+),score=53.31 GEMP01069616.1:53-889(+)
MDETLLNHVQEKLLGNEKWSNQDYEGALDHYYQALKDDGCDDPTKLACYINIAICSENLGRYELALDASNSALALSSHNVKARFRKGCVLTKMGRLAEAEESVRAALEVDPDSLQIQRQLALIQQHASQKARSNRGFENMMGALYEDKPARAIVQDSAPPQPKPPPEHGRVLWNKMRASMLRLPLDTIASELPFDSEDRSSIQNATQQPRQSSWSSAPQQHKARNQKSSTLWGLTSFFNNASSVSNASRDFIAAIDLENKTRAICVTVGILQRHSGFV